MVNFFSTGTKKWYEENPDGTSAKVADFDELRPDLSDDEDFHKGDYYSYMNKTGYHNMWNTTDSAPLVSLQLNTKYSKFVKKLGDIENELILRKRISLGQAQAKVRGLVRDHQATLKSLDWSKERQRFIKNNWW
eukprot:CAMPEP_0115037302 /NCGR_PEP_ID=MMETSP0216-20121206/42708_1 /TAXON_ID=223996 /ORGANISM="Protocruzia adherens, Strain Boccale" /LENGTH=133 /DNA_ID=CAMNT_0002417437 /DNA_START=143 /DNA_END=541 /DNA_ORIENTATION=-